MEKRVLTALWERERPDWATVFQAVRYLVLRGPRTRPILRQPSSPSTFNNIRSTSVVFFLCHNAWSGRWSLTASPLYAEYRPPCILVPQLGRDFWGAASSPRTCAREVTYASSMAGGLEPWPLIALKHCLHGTSHNRLCACYLI